MNRERIKACFLMGAGVALTNYEASEVGVLVFSAGFLWLLWAVIR